MSEQFNLNNNYNNNTRKHSRRMLTARLLIVGGGAVLSVGVGDAVLSSWGTVLRRVLFFVGVAVLSRGCCP